MIFASVRLSVFSGVIARYPALGRLVALAMPARLVRSREEHRALSRATALRRLEGGNVEREDFMSYILRYNDEKGMEVGEIVENANILVGEIRGAFESEGDITLLGVNNLEYMNAVFEEGFRMCKIHTSCSGVFLLPWFSLLTFLSTPTRPSSPDRSATTHAAGGRAH